MLSDLAKLPGGARAKRKALKAELLEAARNIVSEIAKASDLGENLQLIEEVSEKADSEDGDSGSGNAMTMPSSGDRDADIPGNVVSHMKDSDTRPENSLEPNAILNLRAEGGLDSTSPKPRFGDKELTGILQGPKNQTLPIANHRRLQSIWVCVAILDRKGGDCSAVTDRLPSIDDKRFFSEISCRDFLTLCNSNCTLLHCAAIADNSDIIDNLVYWALTNDRVPKESREVECIESIYIDKQYRNLSHGLNLDAYDRNGFHAVHYAAAFGCSACMMWLIHHGATFHETHLKEQAQSRLEQAGDVELSRRGRLRSVASVTFAKLGLRKSADNVSKAPLGSSSTDVLAGNLAFQKVVQQSTSIAKTQTADSLAPPLPDREVLNSLLTPMELAAIAYDPKTIACMGVRSESIFPAIKSWKNWSRVKGVMDAMLAMANSTELCVDVLVVCDVMLSAIELWGTTVDVSCAFSASTKLYRDKVEDLLHSNVAIFPFCRMSGITKAWKSDAIVEGIKSRMLVWSIDHGMKKVVVQPPLQHTYMRMWDMQPLQRTMVSPRRAFFYEHMSHFLFNVILVLSVSMSAAGARLGSIFDFILLYASVAYGIHELAAIVSIYRYMQPFWKKVICVALTTSIASCVLRILDPSRDSQITDIGNMFRALSVMLSIGRSLEAFLTSPTFGPITLMIFKMTGDIVTFINILVLCMIAFSCSLVAVYSTIENDITDSYMLSAFSLLWWSLFGYLDFEALEAQDKPFVQTVGLVTVAIFLLLSVILLLNLLIALMSESYSRVSSQSDMEWKASRTELLSVHMKRNYWLPMPFDTPHSLSMAFKFVRALIRGERTAFDSQEGGDDGDETTFDLEQVYRFKDNANISKIVISENDCQEFWMGVFQIRNRRKAQDAASACDKPSAEVKNKLEELAATISKQQALLEQLIESGTVNNRK